MVDKTCKNCTHWKRTIDRVCTSNYYDPVKVMENVSRPYGDCNCDKFVESEDPPIDGLQYWDYESYSAGFNTGENFGCIHFKEETK